MSDNSFGKIFRISTFGESHGPAIGVVIDGCPAGVTIDIPFIQTELDRRKPGQSSIVTQRKEADNVEVLSGVFEGKSTGTPIALLIRNKDQKSKDYKHIKDKYRPSHADYTYQAKYGIRDYRGGGRSSARETAARVAAGAIAKIILAHVGVEVTAYVYQTGHIGLNDRAGKDTFKNIEKNIVRCPDPVLAKQMESLIAQTKKAGDTIGGLIACSVFGVPAGWGAPVFDKLHADLGKAILSINACKGFEIGSGFSGALMNGSEHNDAFYIDKERIKTKTNHSGGVQGGISNGMEIYFKAAFKPVATIIQAQESVNEAGENVEVKGKGRHDPCVLPRAVPIVEAMTALVLVDHLLRDKTSQI